VVKTARRKILLLLGSCESRSTWRTTCLRGSTAKLVTALRSRVLGSHRDASSAAGHFVHDGAGYTLKDASSYSSGVSNWELILWSSIALTQLHASPVPILLLYLLHRADSGFQLKFRTSRLQNGNENQGLIRVRGKFQKSRSRVFQGTMSTKASVGCQFGRKISSGCQPG